MLHPGALRSIAVAGLGFAVASGCRDEIPPVEREVSMEAPARPSVEADDQANGDASGQASAETSADHPALPERPPADPEIGRALDLISASGLRFIDQAADAESRPSEYTAEQFSAMLRSKWDWIGYDITKFDAWFEEIATRSFKTNLPYLVVLADGTTTELRGWLAHELEDTEDP